jgi:hypothetical protein
MGSGDPIRDTEIYPSGRSQKRHTVLMASGLDLDVFGTHLAPFSGRKLQGSSACSVQWQVKQSLWRTAVTQVATSVRVHVP